MEEGAFEQSRVDISRLRRGQGRPGRGSGQQLRGTDRAALVWRSGHRSTREGGSPRASHLLKEALSKAD